MLASHVQNTKVTLKIEMLITSLFILKQNKVHRLFSIFILFLGKGLTIVCSVLEGEYHKMFSEAQAAKLVNNILCYILPLK